MATEIDERVVEMRFNNRDFEKHAHATMSTLDKLNQKLKLKDADKGVKALETAFNKVKLDPIGKSIDVVNVKFKALELAGITAFQNITNKAVDAGEKLIKSLSVDQITEGFSKYEQKTSAVQTIMNATGKSIDEVSSSLEKLNWFTDETSYNFIDMVNNIGKFTSAGVDLDVAITAMEGIATEAALSGQGINEASRAMYNFAQAIGVGEVKLIDWKSIENANMATKEFKENIIDVAIAQGTLVKSSDGLIRTLSGEEVSYSNFSENLKEGWFTSDVLLKSLQRYGEFADKVYDVTLEKGILCAEAMELVSDGTESLGERAFKAAQEAKTFTDAINATKDAVSTGWMSSFEIIFGNYEKAKVLWTELANTLYEIFAEGGEARNELLGEALNSSSWEQFKSELDSAGLSMEEFQNDLSDVAKKHGVVVDEMIKQEGSFEAAVQHGGLNKFIAETLTKYTDGVETVVEVTDDMTDRVEEFNRLVNDVRIGKFGAGAERVKALTEAGYDYSLVQSLVNKVIAGGTITVEDLGEAQTKTTKTTKKYSKELQELGRTGSEANKHIRNLIHDMNRPTGRELLIDSFRNGLKAIIKGLEVVKESWNEIFPPMTAERLYNIIEKFHSFTENLVMSDETAGKLKRTLKGVFAVLDIVKQIIWSIIQNGLNIFRTLLGKTNVDVLEFTASLGDTLVALDKWLAEGNKISSFLGGFVSILAWAIKTVREWTDAFFEIPEVSTWLSGLNNAFQKLKKGFVDIGKSMTEGTLTPLEAVMEGFRIFRDTILSYVTGIKFEGFDFSNLFKSLDFAKTIIANKFSMMKSEFSSGATLIWGILSKIAGFIVEFIKDINPLIIVPLMFIGVIKSFDKFTESVTAFAKILSNFLNPITTISNAVSSALGTISKAIASNFKANTFLKVAGAIAILTASIVAFSFIDTVKLIKAGGALVVTAAILIGTVVLLSKNENKIKRLGSIILGISIGIAVLIGALKLFEFLNPNAIGTGLMLITVLMVELVVSVIALSKFAKEASVASIFIITFAASVALLVASLRNLNKVDTEGLGSKIGALSIIIFGFGEVILSASKIKISNAFGLLGVVSSIFLIMLALEKVSEFDPISIKENWLAFVEVFGALALIVLATRSIKNNDTAKFGITVLGISASIYILIPAIKKLSELSQQDLKNTLIASAVVAGLALVMGGVIRLTQMGTKYALRSAAMIMLISGAVAALAVVIWGLSMLDGDAVVRSSVVVGSILFLMGLIIAASSLAKDSMKAINSLTILALLLGVFLGIMSYLNVDNALKAAASLGILFIALSASLLIISKTGEVSGKAMFALLVLSAIAGLLALVISKIPNEKTLISAIAQATALGELMLALSACVKILSKVDMKDTKMSSLGKTYLTLAAVILAMAGVSAVFTYIAKFDAKTALAQSQVLVLVLLELTIIAGILGSLYNANTIGSLGKTYLTLGVLLVCMTSIAGLLLLIRNIDGSNAIKQIAALSIGMLALVGLAGILALMAPVLGAVVAAAPEIFGGLALTELIILGVVSIYSLIDASWQFLAALVGEDYSFSKALTDMGDGIGGFFGGIAKGFINAVAKSDIEGLSAKMKSFAGTIMVIGQAMSSVISTMDEDKIKMIDDFATALYHLGQAVLSDAIVQTNLGDETGYASLTSGLTSWVTALRTFGEEMKKLGDDNLITPIHVGADISKKFAEVLESIPNSGGLASVFAGDNTWRTFKKGLVDYAEALRDYGDTVKGLKVISVLTSIPATKALLKIYQNIPNTGGVAQIFTGDGTWVNFSTGLKEYGEALAGYATAVVGLETDAISNSIKPSEDLIQVLEQVPAIKAKIGIFGTKTEAVSWTTMHQGLEALGTAMVTFGSTMSSAEKSGALAAIATIVPYMKTLAETLEIMDRYDTNHVYSVVNNYASAFELLNDEGLNITSVTVNEEMLDKAFRVVTRMNELAGEVSSGSSIWNWKKNSLKSFGDDIYYFSQQALMATENLNDIDEKDFEKLAKYLILGFTNGIENGLPDAKEVVIKFTDTVMETEHKGFDEHSPSRKTYEDAVNWLKGFGNGILENLNIPIDAVNEFVSVVLDSDAFTKLTPAFKGLGVDLGSAMSGIFGDFSGVDMTNLSDNFETALGNMQTKLSELTSTFGEDSEQVKAYKKEIEGFKNEFSQFSSMYDQYSQTVEELEKQKAIDAWTDLWDNYKKGYYTAAEYDKYYTHVLEVNSKYMVDIMKQATETMTSDIENTLNGFRDEFESTLSDAYSSITEFAESNSKTYSDVFKHTTYGDLYDKQMESYTEETERLNKELEKSKKLYGENSAQARWYAKEIERVKEEQEKWEEDYKKKGYEDDEIAATEVVNVFKDANKELAEEKGYIERLLEKKPDQGLLDWLGGLEAEERMATLKAIDKMTERELDELANSLAENYDLNYKIGELLNSNKIADALTIYTNDIKNYYESLPETTKPIGEEIIRNLVLGLSEEAEASLAQIGSSGDSIINQLKLSLFGPDEAKPDDDKNIGAKLGNSWADNFIDTVNSRAGDMQSALTNAMTPALSDIKNQAETALTNGMSVLTSAISMLPLSDKDATGYTPKITPTHRTLSYNEVRAQLPWNLRNDPAYVQSAMKAMEYNNQGVLTEYGYSKGLEGTQPGSVTYNQYINSPKTLDRVGIYRDTQHMLQIPASR